MSKEKSAQKKKSYPPMLSMEHLSMKCMRHLPFSEDFLMEHSHLLHSVHWPQRRGKKFITVGGKVILMIELIAFYTL